MNKLAYNAGARAALEKFGGAASAAPADSSSTRDSGSPVTTTTHRDSMQNISQNFNYNASLSDPSSFTQPAHTNSTMQGGTPKPGFTSDTTGGLRDS